MLNANEVSQELILCWRHLSLLLCVHCLDKWLWNVFASFLPVFFPLDVLPCDRRLLDFDRNPFWNTCIALFSVSPSRKEMTPHPPRRHTMVSFRDLSNIFSPFYLLCHRSFRISEKVVGFKLAADPPQYQQAHRLDSLLFFSSPPLSYHILIRQ